MQTQKHTCIWMALAIILPHLLLTSCKSSFFNSSFITVRPEHAGKTHSGVITEKQKQVMATKNRSGDSTGCMANGEASIAPVATASPQLSGPAAGRKRDGFIPSLLPNKKLLSLPGDTTKKVQPRPGKKGEKKLNEMALLSFGLAVAGLYLYPVIGPFLAIFFGIMALVQIHRNPDTMGGKGWAIAGITLAVLTFAFYLFILISILFLDMNTGSGEWLPGIH